MFETCLKKFEKRLYVFQMLRFKAFGKNYLKPPYHMEGHKHLITNVTCQMSNVKKQMSHVKC